MAAQEIQQLVHGYRHGHEQLAASIKLSARDAELSTRLSDLSGNLSGAPKFDSYLTVYPLPSGKHFALGRTWPDSTATRSGCVLTHTLLVPTALWMTLEDPRVLDGLFTLPSEESIGEFRSKLAVPKHLPSKSIPGLESEQGTLLTFVRRYFVNGERPIVWIGQCKPEEILWALLRGLWPKLRATFSACTFCLQPRTLEDRPFEFMFAPSAAYPRFPKVDAEHFIDSTSGFQTTQQGDKVESWANEWAEYLFGRVVNRQAPTEPDLWGQLDEDPTAIRRLFLFKGIMEANDPAPQVYVGAMDLVASIAKDGDSAVVAKQRVAERAVRATREVGDPASGLECLRLIEDRLRRASFSRVQNAVGPALLDAVAARTLAFPELTLQSSVTASVELELNKSWFGRGVLQGFRTIAQREPNKLLVLRNAPEMVTQMLATEPELSNAFVRAVATQRADPSTREDLLRWLAGVDDRGLRSALRTSLVPMLRSDDIDIFSELLKDLPPAEVGVTLSALWQQTDQFEAPGIHDLVVGQVARDHPSEVRRWTRELPGWTDVAAHLFAATYPTTPQGLLELLDTDTGIANPQRAAAIAAFMQGLGPSRYPSWFLGVARENISLLSILLTADPSVSPTVAHQTQKLLTEIRDLPIARSSALLEQVVHCSQQPFFETLIDVTMRSVIEGYVAGAVEEAVIQSFQQHEAVASWFRSVESRDLRSLVTIDARSSTSHWVNAWRWIAVAPDALYARDVSILRDLIAALSRSHSSDWSDEISNTWSQILGRCRSKSGDPRTRIVLCVQALKYSFKHTSLPLGVVVAEAFYDVYTAVTESSVYTAEAGPLFSVFDWDKGKELRRTLVDSFSCSKWRPDDLVLAASNVHLLRKIFKRLTKKPNGDQYAQTALAQLRERTDQKSQDLAQSLRGMLANPGFDEAWD